MNEELPVARDWAGPVGLAAAAHLAARGLTPLIFERGPRAGNALLNWAHVRMFSPWRYNVDHAARPLLETAEWNAPDPDCLPTGGELVSLYLDPLAAHAAIAPHLRFGARVTAITGSGSTRCAIRAGPMLLSPSDGNAARARIIAALSAL